MKHPFKLPALLIVLFFLGIPVSAPANCLGGLAPVTGAASDLIFFPNWTKAYGGAFQAFDYWVDCGTAGCAVCHPASGDSCGGTALQIAGLTVANFGTAVAVTDITKVYWLQDCTMAGGGLTWHTMVNVAPQMWTWAWDGVEANPTLLGASPLVGQIKIYVDIAPTPTDGVTVQMGIPYDPENGYQGGLADRCCCTQSWSDLANPIPKTIKYVAKFVDKYEAAPGDTLNYTIYYSKPGAGNIQNVQILDTQPPYTHWNGTASQLPDPGWDPNWTPPPRLRWTVFPASTPVAGGGTSSLTFQMTIDWGNGESFEPGSGDVAGPENYSLWNSAVATFPNIASPTHYSNKTRTTVKRFLFWKLGDRDVIYNNTPSSVDEITYTIFIKNLSATKTWWDVSIWDTVPLQVNPWALDCGVEDSCVGWTMTPSGCALGGAGKIVAGGQTIITWRLDMPPYMTLNLRWKAKVASFANAGQICVNKVSVLEYGRTNIVDGTGHSITPSNFTHKARVILRTTYVSYVAYNVNGTFGCSGNYFIAMYPMHPSSAFQLFRLSEAACTEGTRPSIITPAPAYPCNSWPGPGCNVGIERRPQLYGYDAGGAPQMSCAVAFHYYKLVSNAPLLWEVLPVIGATDQDSHMYCTTTNLSFRGNTSYTYRRELVGGAPIDGDYFGIANSEDQTTTVHLFQWDDINLEWDYQQSRTIDPLSQWMTGGTNTAQDGHWRIISSDSDLFVWKGYTFGTSDADNYCTMAPEMDGNLVGAKAGDEFWVYAGKVNGGATASHSMLIQNIGTADASFQIMKYLSSEMFDIAGATPANLGGASGEWAPFTSGTVPFGQSQAVAPFNPYYYGKYVTVVGCMDRSDFTEIWQLIRVKLVSNGVPVQIKAGQGNPERYGGFSLHGKDASGNPSQTSVEWWHSVSGTLSVNNASYVSFCSAKGMAVQITTEDGFSATYTTTGPDQPIVHCSIAAETPVASCGTNYKFRLVTPGKTMVANVCGIYFTERGYAAPFLSTGTHYEITAPPVVFVGQNFWITVAVIEQGGGTKVDYVGTTSFSSTDPKALIQSLAMDTYNYVWVVGDTGVKIFINVQFNRLGLINLSAQDTLDGSITGMTTVMVVGADVKLEKRKKLSVAASGDTVQFWLCWSNYSSATAYSFTITDAVPNGTTYVPELASQAICGQNGPFDASVSLAASTSTTTTPPTNFATVNPGSSAGSTSRWLRWTVRDAYVNSTGCVCFKVVVN